MKRKENNFNSSLANDNIYYLFIAVCVMDSIGEDFEVEF